MSHDFTLSLLIGVEEPCLLNNNVITILVVHVLTELVELLLEIQVLLLVVTFTSEVFFRSHARADTTIEFKNITKW